MEQNKKKLMKSSLLLLPLAFFGLAALCACSGSDDDAAAPMPDPEPQPAVDGSGSDNGHDYVDLGLSVKWGTCNIGADTPAAWGDYIAWGETEAKDTIYYWGTYKYGTGDSTLTKYSYENDTYHGPYYDGKTTLDPEDDAAAVRWGGAWRMPTPEELGELAIGCTWEWETIDSVKGMRLTGPNGNSIFLPAAGHRGIQEDEVSGTYTVADLTLQRNEWGNYASDSLSEYGAVFPYEMGFCQDGPLCGAQWSRYTGISVRAVHP